MTEWISVDDRIPDEGVSVFAYAQKCDEVYLAYWTGLAWYNEIGVGIDDQPERLEGITHWCQMSWPEPPKDDENK